MTVRPNWRYGGPFRRVPFVTRVAVLQSMPNVFRNADAVQATEECLGSKAHLRTIFAGIPPGLRQALLIHSDLPGPNPNIKQTQQTVMVICKSYLLDLFERGRKAGRLTLASSSFQASDACLTVAPVALQHFLIVLSLGSSSPWARLTSSAINSSRFAMEGLGRTAGVALAGFFHSAFTSRCKTWDCSNGDLLGARAEGHSRKKASRRRMCRPILWEYGNEVG